MKQVSTKTLKLTPLDDQWNGSELTRSCRLTFADGNVITRTETLWYRFEISKENAPDTHDCASYLTTFLLDAMAEQRDVIVEGYVTHSLLSNLTEWQRVLSHWYPDRYSIVSMHVDTIAPEKPALPGAVTAFSGGLDAQYTAWTHTQKLNGYRTQDIKLGVLVHGFDIAIEEEELFKDSRDAAKDVLANISVPFVAVATNYRELSSLEWEDSHGAALVATLRNFQAIAGNCLIGSSYVYNKPWRLGSSPVTDHLLGDDGFKAIHDGAAVKRTEKAKAVADWTYGADRLRICYNTPNFENCGKCLKCWTTAMCFLAQGIEPPKSLQFPIDTKGVRAHMLYGDNGFFNPTDIYETARDNKIDAPWYYALRFMIMKSRFRRLIRKGYFFRPAP